MGFGDINGAAFFCVGFGGFAECFGDGCECAEEFAWWGEGVLCGEVEKFAFGFREGRRGEDLIYRLEPVRDIDGVGVQGFIPDDAEGFLLPGLDLNPCAWRRRLTDGVGVCPLYGEGEEDVNDLCFCHFIHISE